jgi:hypothetical protein
MEQYLLFQQLYESVARYQGRADVLRNALGATIMAQFMGWRVVKMLYGATVYKKYQKIVGIDFESYFPEEARSARKSSAYRVWKETDRFWDIVTNRVPVPDGKGTITLNFQKVKKR